MKKKCLAWILSIFACVGSFSACEGFLLNSGSGDSSITSEQNDSSTTSENKSEYDIIGEEVTAEEWQTALNSIDWRYCVIEGEDKYYDDNELDDESCRVKIVFNGDMYMRIIEDMTSWSSMSYVVKKGGFSYRWFERDGEIEHAWESYSGFPEAELLDDSVGEVIVMEELADDGLEFKQDFTVYEFDREKGAYYWEGSTTADRYYEILLTIRYEVILKDSKVYAIKVFVMGLDGEEKTEGSYAYYFVKEAMTLPAEDELHPYPWND